MNSTAQIERPFTDLDPAEAAALLHYREREAQAAQEAANKPEEPTPAPEEPTVETHDVERFVPWDLRLANWTLRNLGLGTRDGVHDASGARLWLHRKALAWFILAYPRFRRMLWVVTSGQADEDVAAERDAICNECPKLKVDRKGHQRCGSCGCPDWHVSRLRVKNRFAANHCPEKRHPGGYVRLVMHTWPNRKLAQQQQPTPRGGCGGRTHG